MSESFAPMLGQKVVARRAGRLWRIGRESERTGKVVGFSFASDQAIVSFPSGAFDVPYEDMTPAAAA